MVFIIRAFGGEVCWEGEGSPYDERDGGVTHHVCDRPLEKDQMKPQREYVQPQWVVDCANWRVLIPTAEYAPGAPPPPHLSPFVDADDEGYTPDYQQTLMRLRAPAKAAREGRSLASETDADAPARLLTAGGGGGEGARALRPREGGSRRALLNAPPPRRRRGRPTKATTRRTSRSRRTTTTRMTTPRRTTTTRMMTPTRRRRRSVSAPRAR